MTQVLNVKAPPQEVCKIYYDCAVADAIKRFGIRYGEEPKVAYVLVRSGKNTVYIPKETE